MSKDQELSTRNLLESRPWTSADIDFMRRNNSQGALWIALQLGRTVRSVKAAANRNRISLRRSGERRGLLLGQRRDESLADLRQVGLNDPQAIRDAVVDGRLDLADVERQIQALTAGDVPPICPACGVRNVDRAVGWCSPCYARQLAAAHRDQVDRLEAQRDLDAARQAKARSRRRAD